MSDKPQTQTPEADPLAVPASKTNTDYPLLKPGKIYRFNVKDITVVPVESEDAPQDAKRMVIKLAIAQDERDVNNEPLYAGFVVTNNIHLYAKGERTMQHVARDLATFIKAVEGKDSVITPRQLQDNPAMFNGRVVDATVGISHDKAGVYPDRNTVRFQIPS